MRKTVDQILIEWVETGLANPDKPKTGLAEAIGREPAAVTGILKGTRQIKASELPVIARYLGISPPAELLGIPQKTFFSVKGLVGAGAIVEDVTDPRSWDAPPTVEISTTGGLGALLVRGNSQWPRFLDGEFVLFDMEPRKPGELVDQYAIVQTLDGRKLIKTIRAHSGAKWQLESHNAPPEAVELLAAWRFLGVLARPTK